MFRIRVSSAIFGLAALLFAGSAAAQVPALVNQEGVFVDQAGLPIAGPVQLRFSLFSVGVGGISAWSETFNNVALVEGYYSVLFGSTVALSGSVLQANPYLELRVDATDLSPRTRLVSVPFALVAGSVAGGTVNASLVQIAGVTVIDANRRWLGDPTGLVGPAGPAGPAGIQGPAGPPGLAGGAGANGSPDTPDQVMAKLIQVDQNANTTLNADFLDQLNSSQFMRTDQNTGTTGSLTAGTGVVTGASGVTVGNRRVLDGNGVLHQAEWDLYAEMRVLTNTAGSPDNNMYLNYPNRGASRTYIYNNPTVESTLTATGVINANGGLAATNRQVIASSGILNQAQWDLYSEMRVLTNTVGSPDHNMYLNYPTRGDSRTFIYNNPLIDGTLTVNGAASLNGGVNLASVSVGARQIIDGTGRLHQAEWDLYSEMRVLTNTAGSPDHNMYINYPNRADSRTYLYNNPLVDGALTVNGGGSFDGNVGVGTTTPDRKMTMFTPGASSGVYSNWRNGDEEVLVGVDDSGGIISTMSNHDLQIRAGGNSTKMTVKASGRVGVGTTAPDGTLDVRGDIRAGNSDIYFTATGHNHTGIGNAPGFAAIENAQNYDALMILGRAGTPKGRNVRLWDYLQVNGSMDVTGNLGIGTDAPAGKLDVRGDIRAGNSDIYFTATGHNHTGIGNTVGYAAIENAQNYDALMILGRAGTSKGRNVRLWDYLQVNGSMDVTGNLGIGTDAPTGKLDVRGDIRAGNSDIYFTAVNHNHTGIGNTQGYAAIENSANYDALMILGRAGTPKGRYVRLWDYLQVNGSMDITGNLEIAGVVTGVSSRMDAARAVCYSALVGNFDHSIIMVPLPNNGADLDAVCHNNINGGWHAGGVAKGNYFHQDCGSLENTSYGGGYTSYATEGYFEANRAGYPSCGPSNSFICCSPQFPN
ncbi:MAG: hypothetical protein EXR71_20600 [Myxococcales bacterium]|nr:hypothetical protein [Myxococcales bacterium]